MYNSSKGALHVYDGDAPGFLRERYRPSAHGDHHLWRNEVERF